MGNDLLVRLLAKLRGIDRTHRTRKTREDWTNSEEEEANPDITIGA